MIISSKSLDLLWCKTTQCIMKHGVKVSGIQEIPNLVMSLEGNFDTPKFFDEKFRQIFGEDRIDYAASVTFVEPKKGLVGYIYKQNADNVKWTNSYWGRMFAFDGSLNQIEEAIKKLNKGKNTKMISIAIYDPKSDHRKVMGGVPCLSSIDIKPRNGRLYLSAFFRSMRFSKAGYADLYALVQLGKYLSSRSGMTLHNVTCFASSCHIFYSGDEYKNSVSLLANMRTYLSEKKK